MKSLDTFSLFFVEIFLLWFSRCFFCVSLWQTIRHWRKKQRVKWERKEKRRGNNNNHEGYFFSCRKIFLFRRGFFINDMPSSKVKRLSKFFNHWLTNLPQSFVETSTIQLDFPSLNCIREMTHRRNQSRYFSSFFLKISKKFHESLKEQRYAEIICFSKHSYGKKK